MNWPASQPAISPRTIQPIIDIWCSSAGCAEAKPVPLARRVRQRQTMRTVLIPVLVLLALTAQPALADDDKKHDPAPRGQVTKTEAQRPAPPRNPEAEAPAVQP